MNLLHKYKTGLFTWVGENQLMLHEKKFMHTILDKINWHFYKLSTNYRVVSSSKVMKGMKTPGELNLFGRYAKHTWFSLKTSYNPFGPFPRHSQFIFVLFLSLYYLLLLPFSIWFTCLWFPVVNSLLSRYSQPMYLITYLQLAQTLHH